MSHPSVLVYVKYWVDRYDLSAARTLEVGSMDINGSPRSFFCGDYVGFDMRPGVSVDGLAMAASLPFADATFDVVVTTEMLEHSPTPWLDVPEMARVLRPGGWLILTTRAPGFPVHDYPSDYYRFTPAALGVLFELAGIELADVSDDPAALDATTPWAHGAFAAGTKR